MDVSTDRKSVQAKVILSSPQKGVFPMDVRMLLADMDPLKILVEYDENDHAFAAYCIDTGAVATADTSEKALSRLQQVLQNDIKVAVRTNSLESLFNASAPGDVRSRWVEAKLSSPTQINLVLQIPPDDDIGTEQPKRGIQSEVRHGKTKNTSAA